MKKRVMSFAERQEDLILLNYLDDVEKGFYVDVGANDPWDCSVTKLFYDLGWSGINIEPLPDMYDELCKDRPRDLNFNLGAGNKEDILELYMSGGFSTFDKNTAKTSKVFANYDEKKQVKIRKLTDIISENVDLKNTEIHFIKIDVEGFEKNVLLGLDLKLIRPWILAIESTLPGTKIPSYQEWEHILIESNYSLICDFGINRYYVDNNKKEMFENKNFKNLNEKYDIWYVFGRESKAYGISKFFKKSFIHISDLYYRIRSGKLK